MARTHVAWAHGFVYLFMSAAPVCVEKRLPYVSFFFRRTQLALSNQKPVSSWECTLLFSEVYNLRNVSIWKMEFLFTYESKASDVMCTRISFRSDVQTKTGNSGKCQMWVIDHKQHCGFFSVCPAF